VDSCISDFPYGLSFMGKKWDNTGNFYEWNKARAEKLLRVIKHGGYVAIFGHPKTNHRMKCAFEDVGFRIVEEIDWVYLTGMPKNQDIGKLFDKAEGVERKVVGIDESKLRPNRKSENEGADRVLAGGFKSDNGATITEPSTELAKKWNGWKTAGLKPAHEPITVFQKPLEGTYIQNIEKYGCGAMNIDACRIPISKSDIDMLNKKASKKPTTNYSDREDKVYGSYAEDKAMPANELGRFPCNMIVDEYVAEMFDEQTGNRKGGSSNGDAKVNVSGNGVTPLRRGTLISRDDEGGGSRMLNVIKYNAKVSPSERKLPNGERNPHVTLKPVELIKWLIKLLTPLDGTTIDITAGSCTHAVACEQLNKSEGYNLKYIDVEWMNTKDEPYCNVGKIRVKTIK
jgi:site-specific DNA-methyltransferase (adenine-specific)